jgi:putative ABC transport system permease protein
MPSLRWRKVLRDLWNNKSRTALVVLSIAVGVFAVGTVIHMHVIISQDLVDSYEMARPPHVIVYTEEVFDEELLSVIGRMPEVRDAVGRHSSTVTFRLPSDDDWHAMQIFALQDYENIRIGKVESELVFEPDPRAWPSPAVWWPPPEREIVLERTSLLLAALGLTRAHQGDTIVVEAFTGKQRQVRLAGLCYDFSQVPATSAGMAYGFVTLDTLEWLGLPRGFNELYVLVAGDPSDWEHVKRVAATVGDRVERAGYTVVRTEVPEPGKLPLDRYFRAFTLILAALGSLTLFLAAFLEINTVSALMVRHVRQIGIMKAIGARTFQIVKMYLGYTAIFGLLSLAISVPLAAFVARHAIKVMAYFINFKLGGYSIPPRVVFIEVLVALLVPALSALYPVITGARITVRGAISHYGLDGNFSAGFIDRLLGSVRRLPRPLLLSLRNSFRCKDRMLLTLTTLALGGAIFIAIPSVRASLDATIDEAFKYWQFDGRVQLDRSYRIERLEPELSRIPGVVAVEGWGSGYVWRVRPDGSESEQIVLEAPSAETEMLQPELIAGRWLRSEDENAIVINNRLREQEPDIAVGEEIMLEIDGRETSWWVVGVVKTVDAVPIVYVNYPHFASIVREVGSVASIQFVTEKHDAGFQESVRRLVVQRLEDMGIGVIGSMTSSSLRAYNAFFFDIIATLLMIMATLIAIVGGLGLMGTTSLNVLERTREVGVMRAVGASHGTVQQIFIVEGLSIGILSWVIGTVLSLPVGKLLSDAVGMQLFRFSLNYVFSLRGVITWLVLISILSALTTYLPAQRAVQLSVCDALAYE